MSRARVALPRCAHHAHGVRGQIALFMPRLTPDRRFEANAARRASWPRPGVLRRRSALLADHKGV